MQIQVLHLKRTIDENGEELDGAGGGGCRDYEDALPSKAPFSR